MEKETTLIVDPRGRVIHLPSTLCLDLAVKGPSAYLDAPQTTIQEPACMIELSDQELFYFRSVDWNLTLLIRVVFREGIWVATACMENPEPGFIQEQLKEGTFIAGSALG